MRLLRQVLRRPTRPDLPWMLPRDEFHRLMERERSRAERNRRSFSVVELDASGKSPAVVVRVLDLLKQRRRLTDDIGWIRQDAVGILLPETDATGAAAYLEDVHRQLTLAGCDLPARIYTQEGPSNGEPPPPPRRRPQETPSAFRRRAQDRERAASAEGQASPPVTQERAIEPVAPDKSAGCDESGGPQIVDMRALFHQPLPLWKRLGDLLGGVVILAGIWPVMLVVAILVRLTSRGPVIFRQWRAGAGGRPFVFYKFRTMVDGADAQKAAMMRFNEVSGPVFKMKRDPRITPLGRILRRTSLDELPQLWNVLKGDMTLVGPRPPTLDEVPKYAAWQRRRLDLTGGITGLWQVSGRSEIPFEEWMRMDIRYARTRSPGTDIRILLRTVRAVLTGRGAV